MFIYLNENKSKKRFLMTFLMKIKMNGGKLTEIMIGNSS